MSTCNCNVDRPHVRNDNVVTFCIFWDLFIDPICRPKGNIVREGIGCILACS